MNEDIVVSKSSYDNFASPTPSRSFEIVVEDHSFFVNAGWLAELSPFFAEYCFGETARRSLIIDDIKPSDMLEFFRCIFFCPMRKPISVMNVSLILRVASRFDMKPVVARCEQFVARSANTLDRDHLFQVFYLRQIMVTCAVSHCDPNSSTMSVLVDKLASIKDLSQLQFSQMPGDVVAEVYTQKFRERERKRQMWCCFMQQACRHRNKYAVTVYVVFV
uniref:BTB domain-containing protein n=1 Tax=Angiostrongylus cantonensis TaxID=6313 RepID=A0A0K0CWK8_ANGCA